MNRQVKVFTVSQINRYIKSLLEKDVLLHSFFMEGEISNLKRHASGHFYFTLKDKEAAIAAVLFRNYAQSLTFLPENGMKVIAYGWVSVYEKTGQYQLYAELLQPAGQGALYAAFEQLKNKLLEEGLFDAAHKKEINKFPQTVAIVTSRTGAVIRDIIQVAKRRAGGVKLVLAPVAVQGAAAPEEIAAAIDMLNVWGLADTIIVGRGGGSLEDLWAFNDERVCRAVFRSKIPVISAVGHETDITLTDFAADLRAPTPSAAAELAVPDSAELNKRLLADLSNLQNALANQIAYAHESLTRCLNRTPIREPLAKAKALSARLAGFHETLYKTMTNKTEQQKALLASHLDSLEKVSPFHILKRGYSLVYNAQNQLVTRTGQAALGEPVTIRLRSGRIGAVVNHIEKEEELIHGQEKKF